MSASHTRSTGSALGAHTGLMRCCRIQLSISEDIASSGSRKWPLCHQELLQTTRSSQSTGYWSAFFIRSSASRNCKDRVMLLFLAVPDSAPKFRDRSNVTAVYGTQLLGMSQPGWEDLGWENASYCPLYQVILFDWMACLNNACNHRKLQLEETMLTRGCHDEHARPRSFSTANITRSGKILHNGLRQGM